MEDQHREWVGQVALKTFETITRSQRVERIDLIACHRVLQAAAQGRNFTSCLQCSGPFVMQLNEPFLP